jgi:hypothetical protein
MQARHFSDLKPGEFARRYYKARQPVLLLLEEKGPGSTIDWEACV